MCSYCIYRPNVLIKVITSLVFFIQCDYTLLFFAKIDKPDLDLTLFRINYELHSYSSHVRQNTITIICLQVWVSIGFPS